MFQAAIEKKLEKIKTPGLFKPASRHDLLVYDDTPLVGVDRQAVISLMEQWVRDLLQEEPGFAQISIISSLDVIFDVGGQCRRIPFVEWSELKVGDRASLMHLAQRVEEAGKIATAKALREHSEMGRTVYFVDDKGRMIKRTPDGRRFEVRILKNDEEVVVKELSRDA